MAVRLTTIVVGRYARMAGTCRCREANDVLIEALLDDVLDKTMLDDAIQEALRIIQGDDASDRAARLDGEMAKVDRERSRLVSAIAAGGQLNGLIEALQARERRHQALEAERDALRSARRLRGSDAARIQREMRELGQSWRHVLASDPDHARPIVSALLIGRVTYAPLDGSRWKLTGEASLTGLFSRVFSVGLASPTGEHHELETVRLDGWLGSSAA